MTTSPSKSIFAASLETSSRIRGASREKTGIPPPSLIRGGHGISHDGGCVRFDRGSEAGEELFVLSPGIPLFAPQRFRGPLT